MKKSAQIHKMEKTNGRGAYGAIFKELSRS